jgi:diguanylate cyclase (GGDEF)-like protein
VTQARPKILIVNDDADDRETYRSTLSVLDADLLEAADGTEALEAARSHDLAVILLDLGLRGMNGFETASLLRLHQDRAHVPIIFIAPPHVDAPELLNGYRVGAVDCVSSSPNDAEILRHKVRVFLEIHRRRTELGAVIEHLNEENRQFREEHDRFHQLATHDPLTNLPNRALFDDRLDGAIRRAMRGGQHFALAYLDLDRFKDINDRYGHGAGDELVMLVARRLVETMRGTDTVARIGGDEFALLFESLDSSAAAAHLGRKVFESLAKPCVLSATLSGDPAEVHPGVSIGLALYPQHGRTREDLLMHADAAMYEAKRNGGGLRLCALDGQGGGAMHVVGGTDRPFGRTGS